jgi:uncharacterized membrane protein
LTNDSALPGAGVATIELAAMLLTVNLYMLRRLWSKQIENSNDRVQSFRDSRRYRQRGISLDARYGEIRTPGLQRFRLSPMAALWKPVCAVGLPFNKGLKNILSNYLGMR